MCHKSFRWRTNFLNCWNQPSCTLEQQGFHIQAFHIQALNCGKSYDEQEEGRRTHKFWRTLLGFDDLYFKVFSIPFLFQ